MSERFKPWQLVFYNLGEIPENIKDVKKGVLTKRLSEYYWLTQDKEIVPDEILGENAETAWYKSAITTINRLKSSISLVTDEFSEAEKRYVKMKSFKDKITKENTEEISRIENLLFAKGFYCNQEQEENL